MAGLFGPLTAFVLFGRLAASPVVELISKQIVEIRFPDGRQQQFDPFYLRERCTSSQMVNQETLQPLHNPHEFPENMSFSNATAIDDKTMEVMFTDGHKSVFKLENLMKELVDFRQNPIQPVTYDHPKRQLWAEGHKVSKFSYSQVINDEETKYKLLRDLLIQGAVLVQGMPEEGLMAMKMTKEDGESGICVDFARKLSTMKETEWGLFFNIRAKPDAVGNTTMKDLAYTPKAIGLHTDNSFRYPAPDFQLLHALVHCTCGDKPAPCAECSVMNYMVDGFVIAKQLQKEDPEYFDLLSNVPVRFESTAGDGGSALLHFGPHFELELADANGKKALKSLRFGAKAGQYAPPMDAEKAAKFYKARRRFSELMHTPEYRVDHQLREGEMLILDNHRILHARSGILPSDGERNVQGGYMDRDGLELAYERLRRRFQETKATDL